MTLQLAKQVERHPACLRKGDRGQFTRISTDGSSPIPMQATRTPSVGPEKRKMSVSITDSFAVCPLTTDAYDASWKSLLRLHFKGNPQKEKEALALVNENHFFTKSTQLLISPVA